MFKTNEVKIYFYDQERNINNRYNDLIDAQIYKKTVPRTKWNISESSVVEVSIVLIDSQYKLVEVWDEIHYEDDFWPRKLKVIASPRMINFMYSKKLIELKCDLI